MEPEIVVDELAATLEGALASLRAVAADALTPGALIAAERASSRMARVRLAELTAGKTKGNLPLAFADLVEVDGVLDDLLARWEPAERPAVAPRPWVAPVPVVVAAPVVARTPAPAPAAEPPSVSAEAAVIFPSASSYVDDDDDDFAYAASPHAEVTYDEDDDADADVADADDADADVADADDGVAAAAPEGDLWAVDERGVDEVEPAPQAAAPAEASNPWVVYEEQPPRDVYLDDDEDEGYADPSSMDGDGYVVYAEPEIAPFDMPVVDDEPLPAYARPKEEAPGAAAPKPAPKAASKAASKPATAADPAAPQDADDWSFEAENLDGGADRYRSVQNETTRLEDVEAVALPAVEEPIDDEDDEPQTAVVQRARVPGARTGAAAIQLGADGPVVLGAEPVDEHEDELIELGDTRDYGDEEAMDDEETGILGVGVVEYDDDFEDLEDSVDAVEVGSLDRLPVLPTLSPAEIQALCARAAEVGRKSMVDGVALYGDVLDAQPDRVDAMMSRGRLLLDLGDFPGAVSDFQKAEALHPRDADVQVALGDLFFSRKDYNKAVFYYNRALGSEADHVHALARRGMAHYYRKQFTAAVEDLERAKALDKTVAHVDSYIQRAKKRV